MRKEALWAALLSVPLVVTGLVYGPTLAGRQKEKARQPEADDSTCPLTSEERPPAWLSAPPLGCIFAAMGLVPYVAATSPPPARSSALHSGLELLVLIFPEDTFHLLQQLLV